MFHNISYSISFGLDSRDEIIELSKEPRSVYVGKN